MAAADPQATAASLRGLGRIVACSLLGELLDRCESNAIVDRKRKQHSFVFFCLLIFATA